MLKTEINKSAFLMVMGIFVHGCPIHASASSHGVVGQIEPFVGIMVEGGAQYCPDGLCDDSYLSSNWSSDANHVGGIGEIFAHGEYQSAHVQWSASGGFEGDLAVPVLHARAAASPVVGVKPNPVVPLEPPTVILLPNALASASSNTFPRYMASTRVTAIQQYNYTGAAEKSFEILADLFGSFSGQEGYGGIYAFIGLHDESFGKNINNGNNSLLANMDFSLDANSGDIGPRSMAFTLQPGRSVYLEVMVYAYADSLYGAVIADSYSPDILDIKFMGDTDGLSATLLPVPEPDSRTLWFAGLMALGLMTLGRGKKAHVACCADK